MNKGETWVIEYKENNKVLYSLKIEDLIEEAKKIKFINARDTFSNVETTIQIKAATQDIVYKNE